MTLDAATALSLARDAFSASTSYFDSSIRREIEADIRRFQGRHPVGSKYLSEAYRAKSHLFRPKTRATIRKHESVAAEAFFSTRDVVSVDPQDDNDTVQQASAALHKELLQYRLTKTIPWFLTVMGAYQESMNLGLVCSYQYWNYNKDKGTDEPGLRLVPLENVRFDPGANWMDPVNSSPYFIEMIPMYIKDVRSRMQQADDKTGEKKWKSVDDATLMTAVRGYADTIRLQREQGRQDSKENANAVKSYNIVWVHKNIVEHEGTDYCYYTLGDSTLLSDPVPLQERYHHGKRPYVIGYSVLEAHKNYPGGTNRLGKDVQAEVNEVANQRIDNVKLVLNKRYLVGRNRQVDIRSLTRNVAGSVTLVNDVEKDVRELEFSDVTASSYKEQEVLNLDFDEITGNFSSASVQGNRQLNETAKGMELVSTDANQVSGYQLRTFVETWVEPVLRQLVLLEQAYETNEVILALAGKKAKIDELGFDTITDEMIEQELILSVSVGMGATNPQEKVNRLLTAMRALKEIVTDSALTQHGLKFEEVAKEVFGNLGYKDGSRFFDMATDDPRVADLMQQVQTLQQQLDAKHPPELIAAQVKHIEAQITALEPKNALVRAQAVKTGVDASYSSLQAAEVVAAVPQAAPVADTIMQGAGYRVPVPAGVDPNIGQGAVSDTPISQAAAVAPAGGMSLQPIENHRTGVTTNVPGSGQPGGPAPGDTSPNTPANPPSAGTGASAGIETMKSDGVRGMANGGLVDYVDDTGNLNVQRNPFDPFSVGVSKRPLSDFMRRDAIESGQVAKGAEQSAKAQALALASAPPPAPNLGSSVNALPGLDAAPTTIGGVAKKVSDSSLIKLGTGQYGLHDDDFTSLANGGMVGPYTRTMGGAVGMANGGVIQGPGTGTSDSVPAVNAATGAPMAVSNGEFTVSPAAVAALGHDFFERLIQQFHQPVQGQPQPDQGTPPVAMQPGSMVIPADVVEALGVDFFEHIEKLYGGAQ